MSEFPAFEAYRTQNVSMESGYPTRFKYPSGATVMRSLLKDMFPDRPWGPGDNPKTAVWETLKTHPEFEIDKSIQHKPSS